MAQVTDYPSAKVGEMGTNIEDESIEKNGVLASDIPFIPFISFSTGYLNGNPGEYLKSKTLRVLVKAPWFVPYAIIRTDLAPPTVKEEVSRYCKKYHTRLTEHPNRLAAALLNEPMDQKVNVADAGQPFTLLQAIRSGPVAK